MGLGEKIKQQRELMGLTLEAIEEETKIRKFYLQAIENDEFSSLPPRIYATGFVKKYARLLKLNEQETVDEFVKLAYNDEPVEGQIHIQSTSKESGNSMISKIAVAAIFLGLVLWLGSYFAGWVFDEGITRFFNEKPPIADDPHNNPNNEPPPPQEPKTTVVAEVEIEGVENCWLDIQVDGQPAFTGHIRIGEKHTYSGNKSVSIKAGNAGGISITFNGEPIASIGKMGEVKNIEFVAKEIIVGDEDNT